MSQQDKVLEQINNLSINGRVHLHQTIAAAKTQGRKVCEVCGSIRFNEHICRSSLCSNEGGIDTLCANCGTIYSSHDHNENAIDTSDNDYAMKDQWFGA